MRQRQVTLDQHRVTFDEGELSCGIVRQDLGVDSVRPAELEVDPLGSAGAHHEHQGAAVAFDHGAGRHQQSVGQAGGFEFHVGVHPGPESSIPS